ncbi:hypothetical protein NKJ36_23550 [Mesorhizobium sp. M0142]|uniref:hypothetical protein n=1 Tax=Mesorhizobium sp. M0142 TaxID=2956894 RepID=UPI00333AAE09
MRYLAADVYAALTDFECEFDGDETETAEGWFTSDGQIFVLPKPTVDDEGRHWLPAEVIDEIIKDRWLGFTLHDLLARYD